MTRGPQGPTAERLELAARVAELSRKGLLQREISDELGIGRSYVSELLCDPDGSAARARKDSYSLPCPDCGRPMCGSDGLSGAPQHCADCAKKYQQPTWTRESVRKAFRRFHERHGRPPRASERMAVTPSFAAKLSAERLAEAQETLEERLPHTTLVYRLFGSWAAALEYAGLPASPRGGEASHRGERRTALARRGRLLRLIAEGCDTTRALAQTLGCGRSQVNDELRELVAEGLLERRAEPSTRRGAAFYRYRLTEGGVMAGKQFVVLRRTDKGWEEHRTEGYSPIDAIEQVANNGAGGGGDYVAIPLALWTEVPVGQVTKLAVLERG